MIGSSSDSLQTISERLGFASPYHLSAAFKKQFGQSPDHWRRRRNLRPRPPAASPPAFTQSETPTPSSASSFTGWAAWPQAASTSPTGGCATGRGKPTG